MSAIENPDETLPGRTAYWIGHILSDLVCLFLIFDAVAKLVPIAPVTETMGQLGYDTSIGFTRGLGVLILACTAFYAWPRTAVFGAVLLTGLFGGAIATQLRVGAPVFSHLLFGLYLGLMVWGGLVLREPRLLRIFPLRRVTAEE